MLDPTPGASSLAASASRCSRSSCLSGEEHLFGLFCVFNVCLCRHVGFKAAAIATGVIRLRGRDRARDAGAARSPTRELPMYTILVPAFGEANVIAD